MFRQTFFVLLVCLSLVFAQKKCVDDKSCLSTHYCAKSGVCTLKYAKFCQSEDDCIAVKEICAVQPDRERGTCIPNPYLELRSITRAKPPKSYVDSTGATVEEVEEVPMEIIKKIPKSYNIDSALCGLDSSVINTDFDLYLPRNASNAWSDCSNGDCDNPAVRDTFTTSPNKIIFLQWLVLIDGTTSETAREQISVATTELNAYYSTTGFTFKSAIINFSTSQYMYHKVGILNCPSTSTSATCVNGLVLMNSLRGANWQQNGAFQILYRPTDPPTVNGAAYFPWLTQVHGFVIMNPRATVSGSTTLPHEMGHAFGLWHTFHGISEVPCGLCYESVASNESGDMCSDTNPLPRNWVCGDPPASQYPDPCNAQRVWRNTPYTNIMSYGDCRRVFTAQQIRRLRCWFSRFKFKFSN